MEQRQKSQKARTGNYNQIRPAYKSIANNMIQTKLEQDEETEGILLEDKNIVGSLSYIGMDNSEEGIEIGSYTKDLVREKENDAQVEHDKEKEFQLNNLQKGIVLAELLGPPRALKRKIR